MDNKIKYTLDLEIGEATEKLNKYKEELEEVRAIMKDIVELNEKIQNFNNNFPYVTYPTPIISPLYYKTGEIKSNIDCGATGGYVGEPTYTFHINVEDHNHGTIEDEVMKVLSNKNDKNLNIMGK